MHTPPCILSRQKEGRNCTKRDNSKRNKREFTISKRCKTQEKKFEGVKGFEHLTASGSLLVKNPVTTLTALYDITWF
jgi:hypothetical protein